MIQLILNKGPLKPTRLMELDTLSLLKDKSRALLVEDIHLIKKGDIVIANNCFFTFKVLGKFVVNTIYHNEMPIGEITYKVLSKGLNYSIEIISSVPCISFFLSEDEIEKIARDSCHIYVLSMMYLKWIKIAYKKKYIHGIKKESIFLNEKNKNIKLDIAPKEESENNLTKIYLTSLNKKKWFVKSHKRKFKSGKITYVRGYIKRKGSQVQNKQQTDLFEFFNNEIQSCDRQTF